MLNPEQQFGAMRPDTKETNEQEAQKHKDKIDAIVNKRPLESLTQEELNEVLSLYKKIESSLGIAEPMFGNPTIEAKTPEGEKIEFNIEQELEKSIEFYKELNLTEWVDELSKETITLSKEQINYLREQIEKHGFNKMKIFPSVETQQKTLSKLADETHKPIEGLDESEQYSNDDGLWKSSTVETEFPDGIRIKNRPKGIYIQLYKDDREVPDKTLGKTYEEAREILKENNLQGYTLPEYLIFQYEFTKENKKHPEHDNYTWLTDSEIGDLASAGVLRSGWHSAVGQVDVLSSDSDDHNDFLGFRSSAVLSV